MWAPRWGTTTRTACTTWQSTRWRGNRRPAMATRLVGWNTSRNPPTSITHSKVYLNKITFTDNQWEQGEGEKAKQDRHSLCCIYWWVSITIANNDHEDDDRDDDGEYNHDDTIMMKTLIRKISVPVIAIVATIHPEYSADFSDFADAKFSRNWKRSKLCRL